MNKSKRFDEYARVMWVVFLAIWFAIAMVHNLTGCSEASKRDIRNFFTSFGRCAGLAASGSLVTAEQHLMKDISSAIAGGVSFQSEEWKNTGKALAATYGAEVISCLTSSVFNEIINRKNPDMAGQPFKPGMRVGPSPEYKDYVMQVFIESSR